MSKVYQTYYDVSRFVLWADNPAEEGKRSRFVLSFRDGNPRFVVYTGGLGKEGIINFPMDAIHLTAIMNHLKDVANGPVDSQINVDSLITVYENDKPTKQKKVLSTLHMGKTKDGIVYLSVTGEGRPRIIFPIKPSPFHIFRNANKEVIPDQAISKNMALGIADVVLDTVSRMIVDYTNEEIDGGGRKPTSINVGSKGGTGNKITQPQFSDLDDIL
jgi:hypothetical protein